MGMIYGSINYTTSGRKKKRTATKSVRRITSSVQRHTTEPYRREVPKYASAPETNAVAAKVENPKYTGTLVKGIGTMHKSNAIPIINEQEMKDIARMRR